MPDDSSNKEKGVIKSTMVGNLTIAEVPNPFELAKQYSGIDALVVPICLDIFSPDNMFYHPYSQQLLSYFPEAFQEIRKLMVSYGGATQSLGMLDLGHPVEIYISAYKPRLRKITCQEDIREKVLQGNHERILEKWNKLNTPFFVHANDCSILQAYLAFSYAMLSAYTSAISSSRKNYVLVPFPQDKYTHPSAICDSLSQGYIPSNHHFICPSVSEVENDVATLPRCRLRWWFIDSDDPKSKKKTRKTPAPKAKGTRSSPSRKRENHI